MAKVKMSAPIHTLSRALIIDTDHLLLAYDPRPDPYHYYELHRCFYYLPGGHIEDHESAVQALHREMREETGCQTTIERFLGLLEHAWHFPGDEVCCHTHEINMIFKAQLLDLSYPALPLTFEDHVAFKWIPLTLLPQIDLRPALLKEAIPRWLKDPSSSPFWSTLCSL